jgi:MFS family permease
MGAFASRNFRRFFAGEAMSNFGDSALYLALGIWIKDLTGSNAAAGSVFLAIGAPALLAPLAGRVVDRADRLRLLIITNALTALAVLSLLAVRGAAQVWIIYVVAAVYGLAGTILGSGKSALLRDMLDDGQLGSANAAFATLGGCLRIGSPLAGAGIYALVGGPWLAAFDAVTFVGAIAALACVQIPKVRQKSERSHFFREVAAGYAHIRSTRLLFRLMVIGAVAFGFSGLLETVIFAVIDQGLHRPASFFGVVTSVQGAGAVVGGLVAARLLGRLGEARMAGLGLMGVALGSLAFSSGELFAVLGGATGIGIGVTWFAVASGTAIQRFTPSRLQGRVAATANMMLSTPQTTAIALGAALVSLLDYRVVLAIVAAGMAIGALFLLFRSQSRGEQDDPAQTLDRVAD